MIENGIRGDCKKKKKRGIKTSKDFNLENNSQWTARSCGVTSGQCHSYSNAHWRNDSECTDVDDCQKAICPRGNKFDSDTKRYDEFVSCHSTEHVPLWENKKFNW